MISYPAYKTTSPDKQVNVLQITDLHLSTPTIATGTTDKVNNVINDSSPDTDCQRSFEAVLKQALAEDIRCDLIIVTGDLVNKVEPAIYDYIFAVLTATQIPFACIAGNHDVTDEVGQDLAFDERRLVARGADTRLLNRHIIESDYWQLLLLNSAVAGQVGGEISADDIDWLCAQLQRCKKPALLAIHHHLIPMESEWIDAHITQNAEQLWQRSKDFDNLRVIINGHTHQQQVQHRNGVTVYTTPSTCYQFKPFADDFAYETQARPGYRWLQLGNNGQVASWVERLDT